MKQRIAVCRDGKPQAVFVFDAGKKEKIVKRAILGNRGVSSLLRIGHKAQRLITN